MNRNHGSKVGVFLVATVASIAIMTSCMADNGAGEGSVSAPVLLSQPVNSLSVHTGDTVKVGVLASGPSLAYLWVKNGVDTVGMTDTLILTNVIPGDSGSYVCIVRNRGGTISSSAFILQVSVSPPVFTSQPDPGSTAYIGGTVKIGVSADGYGLSYQWIKDDHDTLQQTGDTLTLTNLQPGDDGAYRCVVRNSAGMVESQAAWLQVIPPPPGRLALLDSGIVVYETNCAGCHGQQGEGARAPSLRNADFVMDKLTQSISMVIRGNRDTLRVNGECYEGGGQPSSEWLSDFEIASVLTYIRAALNDSTVVSCSAPGVCAKLPRSPGEIAGDSVSVAEVRAVRDTLTSYPDGYVGATCPDP